MPLAIANSLESEIVYFLRHTSSGSDISNTTRQSAREALRSIIGDNIFHGRVPAGTVGPYAVILKRISTRRFHDLPSEDDLAQAIVQVTVIGNDSPAMVQEICERHLRLSINMYRGTLGLVPTTVYDTTIERDGMPLPGAAYEGSDQWKFSYSMDFRVSYNQEVA